MSNPNLGWLFYKDYFTAIKDWSHPKESEKAISNKVDNIINISIPKIEDTHLGNIHFKASTTYPGLILGSGYLHELPSVEGQAILGFDFDYTTGLPIIRGSSIKGVIKSAFKHWEYIAEISDLKSEDEVKKLEDEIFDNGDIFFDATIISGGKILENDYLAPHGDNPLKNPTPLRFIKVAPNVTFRFDFFLSDEIISKEDKAILFGEILYDLGVGAKTNVGYGKFDDKLTKDRLTKQLKDNQKAKEEGEQKKLDEKMAIEKEKKLANLSPLDALKEQIEDFNDNKNIYDLLDTSKLNQNEKDEIEKFVLNKIGIKPIKDRPAKKKWAIKIYDFFGK